MPTTQPVARAVCASKSRDANRQDTCLCTILILESGQSNYNVCASLTQYVCRSMSSSTIATFQTTDFLLCSHAYPFLFDGRCNEHNAVEIQVKIRKTKIAYFFYRSISALPHSDRLIQSHKTTVNVMRWMCICLILALETTMYCCPFHYYSQRFGVALSGGAYIWKGVA